MKSHRLLALILSLVLQFVPVLRAFLPAPSLGLAPSAWAIVLKLAGTAVALLGSYHAVSAATAIVMPYTVNATNGIRYRRQLGTSGEAAHSWSASTAPLDTPAYPLMFGLFLTNDTGIIGGVPNLAGTTNVTITAWENSGNSGASVSSVFTITVTTGSGPPAIVAQPANLTVLQGSNATFTVSVSGTSPFRYQWRYKGTNIANATNATLSLPNVQSAQAGGYSAAVTNSLGGLISQTATLTVLVKPSITVQPTNFVSFPGGTAVFFIQGAGTLPLSIRWRRNAATFTNGIITATPSNSTLLLSNLDLTNDGASFTAAITNVAGQGPLSAAAILKIFAPPVILTQPLSQNVAPGADVTLSVTARGVSTLRYQWSRDATALPAQTNATLVMTNVQLSDEGAYTVTVTNRDGMVLSDAALLTVGSHPVLSSPEYLPGTGFRFTLEGNAGATYLIDVSTNLPEWNPVGSLNLTNGRAPFVDREGTNSPARIYRARTAP